MAALSIATVLALITTQGCVPTSLAQTMTGIALHESGLNPALIHYNRNGTLDVGLAQINSANFEWLGLTLQDALDPCKNLAAGVKVLLAKYNGSTGLLAATYSTSAISAIRSVEASQPADGINRPRPTATEMLAEHTPARPLAGPSRSGREMSFSVRREK